MDYHERPHPVHGRRQAPIIFLHYVAHRYIRPVAGKQPLSREAPVPVAPPAADVDHRRATSRRFAECCHGHFTSASHFALCHTRLAWMPPGKAKAPAEGDRRGQRTIINPHNTEDTTPPMPVIWGVCRGIVRCITFLEAEIFITGCRRWHVIVTVIGSRNRDAQRMSRKPVGQQEGGERFRLTVQLALTALALLSLLEVVRTLLTL